MVDQARYFVAAMMLVSIPPAVGLWYAIHPLARVWRRVGPVATYAILAPAALATGWVAWVNHEALLGRDLGTRTWLIVAAVPALAGAIGIGRARRRHLTSRILIGVPELSAGDRGRLLTEGIYSRTRNPRYLEFLLAVLAYIAFANFVGTWVLYLLTFPAIHLVVLLEERELRERVGAEYEQYRRHVPRYLPRLRSPAPSP